jgi:hypothetical protein
VIPHKPQTQATSKPYTSYDCISFIDAYAEKRALSSPAEWSGLLPQQERARGPGGRKRERERTCVYERGTRGETERERTILRFKMRERRFL